MIEAALAQSAVSFLLAKAAEGGAQALGSDAYKTAIEKLKGFFSYKFAGRSELSEAQSNPTKLTALIAQEASKDAGFKSELENLVKTLQQLTNNSDSTDATYSNVDSIVNLEIDSASGSNVGGHDVLVGNQVSGSHNYVGGDHRGSSFR